MAERDDHLTAETVVDTPRATRQPPRDIADQTRLGHFHLLEPLGYGGMGTVFSAYDLNLDRKVAIKLLSERDSSSEQDHKRQQRLLREAQAMAKLSHPNIVPVYEVGVEGDTVFIAMEHIDGKTLGEWLKEQKRSWREIVDVFKRAARGLAAAHEAGIVHRDFKPSNVLVDVRGRVRVVDFGIARVAGEDDLDDPTQPTPTFNLGDGDELTPMTPSTPLTEFGSLVGTPAYMSPEQYESAAVDARSDQFSFCVALYDALYGARPFRGRGEELAENVKEGRFDKPTSKTVPSWITACVLRGLAPNPDDRFSSMTELADELARAPRRLQMKIAIAAVAISAVAAALVVGWKLNASQSEVCGGAESYLTDVWDEGRRVALDNSFSAAGVAYSGPSVIRATTILDDYRADWLQMRTDACKATRVRGDQSERVLDLRVACLDDCLGELRALTTLMTGTVDAKTVENSVKAASALTPLAGCADTAALLQPGAEPTDPSAREHRRDLLERLGRLTALRRVGRGAEALERAKKLVTDAVAVGDQRITARAHALQGALELGTGDLKAAEVTLAKAIRRANQLGDTDLLVKSTIDLISTMAEGGISKSREALGMIRFVEAIVEDTHDPILPIRLATEKANEYMVLARHDTALPLLEETLVRGRDVLGDDHVQTFQLRSLYVAALGRQKQHDKARKEQDALTAATTRVLGALHPRTLLSAVATCRLIIDAGSPERGAECFASALPDAILVIGAHNRQLLSYRAQYGSILERLGRPEEARAAYATVLADIPEAAWNEKWFIAADVARSLGWIEVELGDYANGLAHCERAEAATEGPHAGPNGVTCIGEALLGLGNAKAALVLLELLADSIANTEPARLGASRMQVGMWRFAYARAVWEVRRQAKRARELANVAREELGNSPKRAALDAWLATLPRR